MNMLNNAHDYISEDIGKDKANELAAISSEVFIENSWEGIIKEGAFEGITNLVLLNTNRITGIEDGAFKGCVRLEKLVIPNVGKVGDHVFEGCVNLEEVVVRDDNMGQIIINKLIGCGLNIGKINVHA